MKLNKLNERYSLFSGPMFLESADVYQNETTQSHPLGAQAWTRDGKIFRYSLVGTTALVAGNLLQEQVQDGQFEAMSVTASPIVLPQNGKQVVNVTNGTTTVIPKVYVDGTIGISVTPDLGGDYTIQGITGTLTSGGAMIVTVDHPIATAWTTSTKVNMKPSPWAGVIQMPATTQTGMVVGAINWAATASTASYAIPSYVWVQTHGIASILSDGSTFAVGSDLGNKSGTAGCVTVMATATTRQRIGTSRMAAATGTNIAVWLQID